MRLGLVGIAVVMSLGAACVSRNKSPLPSTVTAVQAGPSIDRQASALLESRCAVCHSTDLIAQQRLNRARWHATLQKMTSWGAQLSTAEQELLLNYLTTRQGPDAN
jgi:hypothetical protein